MLTPLSRVLLVIVLLLSTWPARASAGSSPPPGPLDPLSNQSIQPLSSLLNPDGSLNLSAGFSGSLDAGGYRLVAGQDAAPRFVRPDALAADQNWDDRFGNPGVSSEVRAILVDGTDVYIGGTFLQAAQIDSSSILRWDGRRWHDVGGGLQYSSGTNGAVNALALSGGRLYAGGRFDQAGDIPVSNIAVWDGATWSDMSGGVKYAGSQEAAEVFALAAVGGNIYVGGRFDNAGSVSAPGAARWNVGAAAWSSLGTGLGGDIINPLGTAHSFAVDGQHLYVGGVFVSAGGLPAENIARWDTQAGSWSALGTGLTGSTYTAGVYALAVDGGSLYAGGRFDTAGGVPAANIARWNGSSWAALGSGISGTPGGVTPVRSILVRPGGLLVGGHFPLAGGKPVNHLALWDGAGWESFSGGVTEGGNPTVFSLAAAGDDLYVGGSFFLAGDKWANHIARWNAAEWFTLGKGLGHGMGHGTAGGAVFAVAVNQHGHVYVGGAFTYAGGVLVNNVARWDGAEWHALGSGVNGQVNALAVSGDDLYAGGSFTTAGGQSASHIARWDEASQTWSPMTSGVSQPVRALAVGGRWLYAGGEFITAGGLDAWSIARWNLDTHTWSTLSGSFAYPVWSLATYGDLVFMGGNFDALYLQGQSHPVNNIVVWDSASDTWYRLVDDGVIGVYMGTVYALAVHDGKIYAGGTFISAGGRENTGGLAAFDMNTQSWSSLGTGISGGLKWVSAITVLGSGLYVGGDFTQAGGQAVNEIARWDLESQSWSPLGSGVGGLADAVVFALGVSGGHLYTGGQFVTAGGMPSQNFARWTRSTPAAAAVVTPQSGGTLQAPDVTVQFPPQAVTETVDLSYTPATPEPTGRSEQMILRFILEAAAGDGRLVSQFNRNYTLTIEYTDEQLAALGIEEGSLALCYWDGARWVELPAELDTVNNRIILTLDHFTSFALVGAPEGTGGYQVYVPMVTR